MKRNLMLLAIIVTTGISLSCQRFQSFSKTDGGAVIDPATVTDWLETYDIDTEGYPFYPDGDPRHRQYSRRWYPPRHPAHDAKVMSEWSPLVKFDGDFKTLPKIRYSKGNPAVFQAIPGSDLTTESSADDDYSANRKTAASSSKPATSYDSSNSRRASTGGESASPNSTPYKSSNYPSTGSTPYRSSTSTSEPVYKSPSTTTRRKP